MEKDDKLIPNAHKFEMSQLLKRCGMPNWREYEDTFTFDLIPEPTKLSRYMMVDGKKVNSNQLFMLVSLNKNSATL